MTITCYAKQIQQIRAIICGRKKKNRTRISRIYRIIYCMESIFAIDFVEQNLRVQKIPMAIQQLKIVVF
jgi:hypothetical protein